MKIEPEQCAAARALLKIKQTDLAQGIGMNRLSILNFENGAEVNASTIDRIELYFKNHGLRFTDFGGVEKIPTNQIVEMSGQNGFRALMDDVYKVASKTRSCDIRIINGTTDIFLKWLGVDWYEAHAERMRSIKDNFTFKIIASHEGDEIATGFAEYRWLGDDEFFDNCVYIYGDKVAFISFQEDVTIEIRDSPLFAQNQNLIFNYLWKSLGD